jgi:hypothetical protein
MILKFILSWFVCLNFCHRLILYLSREITLTVHYLSSGSVSGQVFCHRPVTWPILIGHRCGQRHTPLWSLCYGFFFLSLVLVCLIFIVSCVNDHIQLVTSKKINKKWYISNFQLHLCLTANEFHNLKWYY